MDSAGNTVKETVYFFNAHPDDLIGSAGMALRPADTGRYTLEVFDLTRGERGLTEARYHGWKSGCEFAECFGSLRVPPAGKRTLFDELEGYCGAYLNK